jgi:alkaline phosphatase D
MRLIFSILVMVLSLTAPAAWSDEGAISRIGFGSCAHQDQPQPIWDAVLEARPDLFLLIGDNIYADTRDMDVMRQKYEKFAAVPGFARLRESVPLLGTWDDHDYGANDAGAEYPMKRESQQEFLDFFEVPQDSPRRTQEGVYHAESFGPESNRVQVILLDTRYFRSRLIRAEGTGRRRYVPNTDPEATILGEAQWDWLEEQLRQPAQVRLIISSIQVVSEEHGGEKWMNIPHERQRLFDLIRETEAAGVIILSGDRHFADLSMMDGGVGYPIYDLTSSALTQSRKTWRPVQTNRHRVATMNFGDNFGLIEIDWDSSDPIISLQIRDVDGDIRINQKLPLSVLQPGTIN